MEFAGLVDLLQDVYGALIISGQLVFPHRTNYRVCWLNVRQWVHPASGLGLRFGGTTLN